MSSRLNAMAAVSRATRAGLPSSPRYMADRELGFSRSTRQLMTDRLLHAQNLFRKDLRAHYGCVNAVEFSNDGEWLVSGGDDRRVLLWNVEKAIQSTAKPFCMNGKHSSNIFCLGFDNRNAKIFSSGNDEQVIVHDAQTGATLDVFLHEEAVYGLSIDPLNDNVFASACDDGRVLVWDIRERNGTEPFCLASFSSAFHAVMYNPVDPRLLATANSKMGVSLWDIRQPKKWLIKYCSPDHPVPSCMSVRFNSSGTQILALRRRSPPILFDLHSSNFRCEFDHRGYYNSCTMKSCCFAGGTDQYVLSGSDDFNLYLWKIPDDGSDENLVNEATMILRGHRSIVNQVRFNSSNFLLASSGVEKIVKLWSPFQMPESSGGLTRDSPTMDKVRKVYTHDEYVNLVMRNGQVMTHDYSNESTQEDPRMMAFFDSLVQREIEGLTSDSSLSGGSSTWLFNMAAESVTLSEIDSSSAASTSSSASSTSTSTSSSSSDAEGDDPAAESLTANIDEIPSITSASPTNETTSGRAAKRVRQTQSKSKAATSTPIAGSSSSRHPLADDDSSTSVEDNVLFANDSSSSSEGGAHDGGRESTANQKRCRLNRPVRTRYRRGQLDSQIGGGDQPAVAEQHKKPKNEAGERRVCRLLRSSVREATTDNGNVASTSTSQSSSVRSRPAYSPASTSDSSDVDSKNTAVTERTRSAAAPTTDRRKRRFCKRRNSLVPPATVSSSDSAESGDAVPPPLAPPTRKRTAAGRARRSVPPAKSLAASVECVAAEQCRRTEADRGAGTPDSGIASQFFDLAGPTTSATSESSTEQQPMPAVVRFKRLRVRMSPINAVGRAGDETGASSVAKPRRIYRRGAAAAAEASDSVK